MKKSYYNSF